MVTDACVCIPWRATDDRLAAFDRVTKFWGHHGFRVITADSDHQGASFNLSCARNRAVGWADTKYIIVADADTIPDIGNVFFALDEFAGVTWPFTHYRHIPADYAYSADLMMSAPVDRTYSNSVGGIFICERELYWELGGCDEMFTGWGFEDNAFHIAAQTLSRVRRLDGTVFSFNHNGTHRDMSGGNPNRTRLQLYKLCAGDKPLMRELIRRV